eukprot:Gb_07086 [translate_table: standard]
MDEIIRTYNDLYREVEQADRLYEDQEKLTEDEEQYRSDLISLKASGLHHIAAKLEVFPFIIGSIFHDLYRMPCLDMVYTAESTTAFFKEKDTVKEVLMGWAEDATKIKRRPSIDYPISYFRKGVRIDKKPDFAEILSYNLHQNWKTAKEGNNFFMDSYVVDTCYASLSITASSRPSVSISTPWMIEEAVERMHLELVHGKDKVTTPPSMGIEITNSIRELYKSYTRAEEARGQGEEAYQKIETSLGKLDEWNAKLAILKNVARRNQLPGLGLMGIEDIATSKSVLARNRHALEDGSIPLAILNRQLESAAQNVKALLDSAGLPPMRGSDGSTPTESELNAILGEFSELFSQQLSSVEERGNQAVLEFVVQVAQKVELAQCLKDTLDPVLAEHTQVITHHSLIRICIPIGCRQDSARWQRQRGEIMNRTVGQRDVEGDQPVPHSPQHEARWEAYLMAKEMTKSLEADISTLDKSVRDMWAELRQVRNATQYLCILASQIVQDLSRVHSHPTTTPHRDSPSEPSSTSRPIIEQIDNDAPMHDDERDQRIPLRKGSDNRPYKVFFFFWKGGRREEGERNREERREKREEKEKTEGDLARGNLWGFLQSRGLPGNVLPDSYPILY